MASQESEKPLAAPRKRRNSRTRQSDHAAFSEQAAPSTPLRPKKRVRFSDPGPSLSTGITPFIQRTSFEERPVSPVPRLSPQPRSASAIQRTRRVSRRRSTSALYESSLSESPAIELTFTPLRQKLEGRVMRRLKRRHLSQEMNDIEADKRLAIKQEQRIQNLEAELEVARQLSDHATYADSIEKVQFGQFKAELDLEKVGKTAENFALPHLRPRTPSELSEDQVDMIDDGCSSPCPTEAFSDDLGFEVLSPNSDPRGARPIMNTVAVQTELAAPSMVAFVGPSEAQKQHLVTTRLKLEQLLPGETCLPLSPSEDGDASPMLDALLSHLRRAMQEVGRARKLLKASEAQESKLRSEFNKSLKQFESARSYNKLLENNLSKVNKIFFDTKTKAVAQLDQAAQQIKDMEQEKKDSEHSISSLTTALEKYRADVKDLEALITSMEGKHADMLSKLDQTHASKVADLHAHINAETRGRRAAESEIESLELQVAEVKNVNQELKQALHQKQKTLREMEADWEDQREHLLREVGSLNVRLCQAQGKAGELEEQLAKERQLRLEAVGKVVEGARRAGQEAVQEIITNEDGRLSFGLLTPQVEGGRFLDIIGSHVNGSVETKRGKSSKRRRNPDSGIGILEEDETELLSSEL